MVEIGKIADFIPNYQVTTVFTSTANLTRRPDLVKRFLAAYRHGSKDYHDAFAGSDNKRQDNDATPAMLALLAKFTDIPAPTIDRAVPYLDADGRVVMSDLAHQIAWYRAQRMVKVEVDPQAIVDTRYAILMPEGK